MRRFTLLLSTFLLTFSVGLPAQEQSSEQNSAGQAFWEAFREGRVLADVRYRFEGYDRDGSPFTGTAYAPTLRIALGYETATFHGFSGFAQGAGVVITGPADYSVPTLPSQNRPDRPAILDPQTIQLSQGYLKWQRKLEGRKLTATVGRQEMALNDGRFVSISSWRQIHESFDAARMDADIMPHLAFTYAFINRYYRVVGHDATDGKPPMHSHLLNLAWQKPTQINVSLYGLLLDYRAAAQYALSTQTFGLRANGPYQINRRWSLLYTAEFANQRNFGNNPNYVNANYSLTELGPEWRGLGLKAGYAFLQGQSSTNEITTPLANPFNGFTELFANTPNVGISHGLEALYGTVSGAIQPLGETIASMTFYDYHSDINRIHYGRELDWQVAYKIKSISRHWEVGSRFGCYWADHLYTNALRVSGYTQWTL